MNKKAVAKQDDIQLPAGLDLDGVFEDADDLNSNMGQGDLAMPFLAIVQKMSPEVDEGHSKYLPAAKAGMFISKVDKQVFDGENTGLEILSCAYDRRFVEWRPRAQGGGRIADYDPSDPIVATIEWIEIDGAQKPMIPNGNLLIETHYHYVLFRPAGSQEGWQFGVLACKGTMVKKSRTMNSALTKEKITDPKTGRIRPLPRWMRKWVITTVREEKDGNSWHNIEFTRGERISEAELYAEGKMVASQAKEMAYEDVIKAEDDEVRPDEVVTPADKDAAIDADFDDEVPF